MIVRVILLLFVSPFVAGGDQATMSCQDCQGLVASVIIKALGKRNNVTSDELTKAMQFICIYRQIEEQTICDAFLRQYSDMVLYTFTNTHLDPEGICALAFNVCPIPDDPFFNWQIPLPSTPKPPLQPIPAPKPDAPKLRVLHITDIHLDLEYEIGSNAACRDSFCCRRESGVPSNDSSKAGEFGDYRSCDVPLWTLESMFEYISTNEQFDYIMWTGDISPHNTWNQSKEFQLNNLRVVDALFRKYFPTKAVYPAVGNHDGFPNDGFPLPSINDSHSYQWYLNELAELWPQHHLPASIVPTVLTAGFYSVDVTPNLRIVSINNNYGQHGNFYLLINSTDSGGQLQWLVDQLQDAENKGVKVHILFHVPTGDESLIKAWSWNFHKIVNRYESTIMGMFAGHHHSDEFQIFYDEVDKTRPVSYTYISLSVTPYNYQNLGYRIYEVDGIYNGSTYAVLNHYNVIANLTDANMKGTINWFLEYDAKSAYGMSSLNPTDWDALVTRFVADDALFQKFYQYFSKSYDDRAACTDSCKDRFIAQMKTSRSCDP